MIFISNPKLRTALSFLLVALLIPCIVLLGALVFDAKAHLWISLSVALLSLVLLVAGFERREIGTRRMVLTSDSGHTVIVYYYPTASALYLPGGDQYTVSLSQEDNEWLIALAQIDMAWRDWGTEKIPGPQKGDGCETATVPEAVVTEKPIDQ